MSKKLNLDDAISIDEFFEGVPSNKRSCYIKNNMTNAETGEQFTALGLSTGEAHKFSFFALSKSLSDKGEKLSEQWLEDHYSDVRLLEREDAVGILFLQGSAQFFNMNDVKKRHNIKLKKLNVDDDEEE